MAEVKKRPDVVSKIARVLYSLKRAKAGANGLKRANNFWIRGYKNYAELQAKSSADIATFMEGLSPEDQASFSNEDIFVIGLVPDHKSKPYFDTDLEEYVVKNITGASVALTYEKAVAKDYKVPGCAYIVFLIGKSAIRPVEVKVAVRTDKRNRLKVLREVKPAAVKKNLRRKSPVAAQRAQVAAARKELRDLRAQRANLTARAQQQRFLRSTLGDNPQQAYKQLNRQHGFTRNLSVSDIASEVMDQFGLVGGQAKYIESAVRTLKSNGDVNTALSIVKSVVDAGTARAIVKHIQGVLTSIRRGNQAGAVDARIAGLKKNIATLRRTNSMIKSDIEELLAAGETVETSPALATLNKRLAKNNNAIAKYRRRLGVYPSNGVFDGGLGTYAQQLQRVNASIVASRQRGATAREALRAAMQKLNAPQQVKQQIAAQALETMVAQQVPLQVAAQQAVQVAAQQGHLLSLPVQQVQQVSLVKPVRRGRKKVVGAQQLGADFSAQQILKMIK